MILHVIGRPRILAGNIEQSIQPRHAIALAYICHGPSHCTRSALASALWPKAPVADAKHSLSQLLHTVKRKYGIEYTPGDVVSVVGVETDLMQVRRYINSGQHLQALELLPGTFLEQLDLAKTALEWWRDEQDALISGLTSVAVEAVLHQDLSLSELMSGIDVVERCLLHQPHLYDERMLLIQSCVRVGDIGRAQRLHAELFASVKQDDGCPSFATVVENLPSSTHKQRNPGTTSATIGFIGRLAELDTLWQDWREVQDGAGCTRVIWGEPGIGKTRLANQLLRRVTLSGGAVWLLNCTAATQRIPYHGARTLLEENAAARELRRPEVSFLRLSSPDLNRLTDPDQIKHQLVAALTAIVVETAHIRPLSIFVDDAQWADDFTALLLEYWSYRLKDERVLLLHTARLRDIDPPPDWLSSGLAGARNLTLGPLNATEADELVAAFATRHQQSFSNTSRAALIETSGGQPFVLLEMLAAAQQKETNTTLLPTSVETLLARRFKDIPPTGEWVVGLLAALAQPISTADFVRMAGTTDKEIATAITDLQRRGILEWSNGKLHFVHDLMRETAYRRIPTGTLAVLHQRAAAFLVHTGGTDGLVAQHYAKAGDADACAQYAMRSAADSRRRHLYADTEYYYRLVIDNALGAARATAIRELFRLLLQLGRIEDAEALLPLLPTLSEDPTLHLLVRLMQLELDIREAATTADDAVGRAKEIIHAARAAHIPDIAFIGSTLLDIALDTGALDFGTDVIESLADIVLEVEAPELKYQVECLGVVWEALSGSVTRAEHRVRSVAASLPLNPPLSTQALVEGAKGLVSLYSGNLSAAAVHYENSLRCADTAGDVRRQSIVLTNLAVANMERGELADARRGFEMSVTSPILTHRIRAFLNLAALHYEQSEFILAAQAADAVLLQNREYNARSLYVAAHAIHGLCALARGAKAEAASRYNTIEASNVEAMHTLDDNSYTLTFLAKMRAEKGDVSGAVQLLMTAADIKRARDAICTLRLEVEAAHITASVDPDRAYALAKRLQTQCDNFGAVLIAARLRQIFEVCRLSR